MSQIDEQEWNSVLQVEYPFLKYGFLWALEHTGATVKRSGWQPQHLTVYQGSELVAFMPLYLKYHSYGEYVFDWSWAEAYERNAETYYPKLLSCIPYTPATGPRLCIASSADKELITAYVIDSLLAHARATKVSSIHVLFPEKALNQRLQESGLNSRLGSQFHWFNNGYESFDGFLETFSSRKRKNVRKERKNVEKQGIQFRVLEGELIDARMWKTFYSFYQRTYLKRSGHGGYLSQAFFEAVAEAIPSQLVMVVAFDGDGEVAGGSEVDEPIAAALYFRDQDTLYGRYWGCRKDVEFLHFETCYYQGIEYCIRHRLSKFDPGAQGEHKIQRGFTPIKTWSNHWIASPEFSVAIKDFLGREEQAVEVYIKECTTLLPFKQTEHCGHD